MGSITGTPIKEISSQKLVSAIGAEDIGCFTNRVLQILKELSATRKTVLLVSHAGVGRLIESQKIGMDPKLFYDLKPFPNATILKLDINRLF